MYMSRLLVPSPVVVLNKRKNDWTGIVKTTAWCAVLL